MTPENVENHVQKVLEFFKKILENRLKLSDFDLISEVIEQAGRSLADEINIL